MPKLSQRRWGDNPKATVRGNKLLEKYISRMDEACGEGKEFIIILKHAKIDEAMKVILEKVSVERSFAGIYTRAKYKNKQISIFRTGKLVIREFNGKKEAESFLEELLN